MREFSRNGSHGISCDATTCKTYLYNIFILLILCRLIAGNFRRSKLSDIRFTENRLMYRVQIRMNRIINRVIFSQCVPIKLMRLQHPSTSDGEYVRIIVHDHESVKFCCANYNTHTHTHTTNRYTDIPDALTYAPRLLTSLTKWIVAMTR